MLEGFNPNRYSIIEEKNKREIVMLVGSGCKWKQCSFCDYHLDHDEDPELCYQVNREVLSKVTGAYQKLEIINSGSFTELDRKTMEEIKKTVIEKNIKEIHFESHYLYRKRIPDFRRMFEELGVQVKMKCGVETFDERIREAVMKKGMVHFSVQELSLYFDEICLLFGIKGQSLDGMKADIETGLKYFERICINIMKKNTTSVFPDREVIRLFMSKIYPDIKKNERIDILLDNTDFGVGGNLND